jgi:hypothetical protein
MLTKRILLLVLTISSFKSIQAQQYATISSYELTIIYASWDYSYTYSGSSFSYANALATLNGRYDSGYQAVNSAYAKLLDLKLINESNQSSLKSFQEKAKVQAKQLTNWNWARSENVQAALKYFNQLYDVESIKNEIIMLQNISKTIVQLKKYDPLYFHVSPRYQELTRAIEELRYAERSQIGDIAWKYGLK